MFNIFSDAKRWREHCKEQEKKRKENFLECGAKFNLTLNLMCGEVQLGEVSYDNRLTLFTGIERCKIHRDHIKDTAYTRGVWIGSTLYAPHQIKSIEFGEITEFSKEDE